MNGKLGEIFNLLDINEENGLATVDNLDKMTNFQKQFFNQVKEKIGLEAVFFLRDAEGIARIPTIYFSAMDKYDPQAIAEIHRLSWNMGEAPLLFIVTIDQLLIYNNYANPRKVNGILDSEAGLIEVIKLVTNLEEQRKRLLKYNRNLLETGEYWRRCKNRFDVKTRVDNTLMNNLKVMRRTLVNNINNRFIKTSNNVVEIVHGLLSRSILIKYLEERKDATGLSVFPKNFYSQFKEGAMKYTDVLHSKESTYLLFECLQNKFNGDMLPLLPNELEVIELEDLEVLCEFLEGGINSETNQLSLWPLYSFNVIPIQLISSIYELFFHLSDNLDDKGTYYTPLHLVDMLLDEVYPWEGEYTPIKVLDPSCGSGIFLVEIYRRMVCRWMASNGRETINNDQLTYILEKCIYGVDLNAEAIRVASFSLSLAMCDFLEPRNIWDDLYFPRLFDRNLMASDFFDNNNKFNDIKYDLIIGNPPWQSQLTDFASKYLIENKKVVGDKQIAQAFTLKCSDIISNSGDICLLLPSKGFLFNRSNKSTTYRRNFISNNEISIIINFSAYRKFLFDHASGPAVAIIYNSNIPKKEHQILYCTPKPVYTVEDLRKFSVEPNDICRIPQDMAFDDRIWKIAMWGSPRDLEVISKMQSSFPTFKVILEENNMCSAEGFKRGNRSKQCTDFLDNPIITAKAFVPFYQNHQELDKVNFTDFECIVAKNREIFRSPHLIMKQSHKNSRFLASVLDYDAVFNHSLLGIHGDEKFLKYFCLIINSKVFSYYHLMTNRRWLVERDELEAGDIWNTPIPIPTKQHLDEAESLFDYLKNHKDDLDKLEVFVSSLYHLQNYEKFLIEDVINYTYDYFQLRSKSQVFNEPMEKDFLLYHHTLCDVLNNTLEKNIIKKSSFYIGNSPLVVLLLQLDGKCYSEPTFNTNDSIIDLLARLDGELTEEKQNLYIRRNVRIYMKNQIYIIKPMQLKYWNFTAASRDADDIFRDIANAWRNSYE